jgi:HK97 family phage major capsid protein
LLLGALGGLTATAIAAGEELAGIKGVLNKTLDPAISVNATILTNQTGFNGLDNMVDGTGRPLLNRDPQTGTPKLLNGKTVHMAADAVLPNVSGKAPVYVGNFTQYATLFSRTPLEIVSTDIGGNAFRSDSIEVRGIKRMSVSKFDAEAVALRTMTP